VREGVRRISSDNVVPGYLVVGGLAAYGSVIVSLIFLRTEAGFGSTSILTTGFMILMVGSVLSVISRITLGRAYHFMPRSKALVTHGIYRWLRHPMYIGNQLMFIGGSVLLGSYVGLLLSIVVLIPTHIIRARFEEKVLADRFKSDFLEYKQSTIM
jgi:protein-S-isoprenylcysteine O-methyltransferase Ste14